MKQANATEKGIYHPYFCSSSGYDKQYWIEKKKMKRFSVCAPFTLHAEGECSHSRMQMKPKTEIHIHVLVETGICLWAILSLMFPVS